MKKKFSNKNDKVSANWGPAQPKITNKEVKYAGKYIFIKELNMRIKLSEGKTIESWLIRYCDRNPHLKKSLYSKYGIPIAETI